MVIGESAASWRLGSRKLSPRGFVYRFSLSYALLMIGAGIQLPFLPLWLSASGLSIEQVATVIAAMTAVRALGAPLFAGIADHTEKHFLVIRACAIGTFLAYAALSQMQSYPHILVFGLLAALLFSPVFPLTEGYSVDVSVRIGLDYGRLRLWASLSFLTGSILSGVMLTWIPEDKTMLLITFGQLLTVFATYVLPPEPQHLHLPHHHHQHVSVDIVGGALKFLLASRFTVFLIAASLASAAHGILYGVSTIYWTELGFSTFNVGALWAAGIIAEVAMFFFSGPLVKRFGVEWLLCLGLAGGVVRWTGMGFATNLYIIGFLQMMHCVSFVVAHISLMHFISQHVPLRLRNTAQGLYAAIASGLLLSSVTWASGPLYDRFSARAFLLGSAIAAVGLGIALFHYYRLSPKAAAPVETSNPLNI